MIVIPYLGIISYVFVPSYGLGEWRTQICVPYYLYCVYFTLPEVAFFEQSENVA